MFITNIKKIILSSIISLLVGCAYGGKSINENESSALQVYPKSISAGEQFRLTFPQLHPRNLSVRSPSGKWFSIQNSEEDVLLIPLKEYNSATELKINTRTLKGITWVNGKKVKDKIFQENGEYMLYMANNLETEPENTFHFRTTIKLISK